MALFVLRLQNLPNFQKDTKQKPERELLCHVGAVQWQKSCECHLMEALTWDLPPVPLLATCLAQGNPPVEVKPGSGFNTYAVDIESSGLVKLRGAFK